MYSHKLVIVLCVVGAVMAYHSNENNDLRIIDSIHNEPQCISQGGLCVIAADCASGSLARQQGLCPEQQSKGVECCYGVSVKESRCHKRGGACMSGCNQRFIQKLATDCPKDTICCILV